jgi:hypothetical protein
MHPRATLLALTLAAASTTEAGELLVLSGNDPIKTRVNEQSAGVQVIFLGSPT